MSFRLVPKSVTLNDLERRNGPYFALFHQIRVRCCRKKSSRSLSHLLMSFFMTVWGNADVTRCLCLWVLSDFLTGCRVATHVAVTFWLSISFFVNRIRHKLVFWLCGTSGIISSLCYSSLFNGDSTKVTSWPATAAERGLSGYRYLLVWGRGLNRTWPVGKVDERLMLYASINHTNIICLGRSYCYMHLRTVYGLFTGGNFTGGLFTDN